jgi:hypothetical protein
LNEVVDDEGAYDIGRARDSGREAGWDDVADWEKEMGADDCICARDECCRCGTLDPVGEARPEACWGTGGVGCDRWDVV